MDQRMDLVAVVNSPPLIFTSRDASLTWSHFLLFPQRLGKHGFSRVTLERTMCLQQTWKESVVTSSRSPSFVSQKPSPWAHPGTSASHTHDPHLRVECRRVPTVCGRRACTCDAVPPVSEHPRWGLCRSKSQSRSSTMGKKRERRLGS